MTLRERMERGWVSGLHEETPCGVGSTLASTESIRRLLPGLLERHGIRTLCDAGAGDLHWMARFLRDNPIGLYYQPFDLIVRHPMVTEWDITREALPKCDAILCRTVLNHLGREDVERTLGLFRESGLFLLATQFSVPGTRYPDFEPYDLREWLGEPIEALPDSPGELALWKL